MDTACHFENGLYICEDKIMLTITQLEDLALADYKAVEGKVIFVKFVAGFVGDDTDSSEHYFNPPIRGRVDKGQNPEHGILHWNDNYLDPYWDVTIVDRKHPQLPKEGLRSCWTDGPSYSITGEKGDLQFTFETWKQRLRRWVFRR